MPLDQRIRPRPPAALLLLLAVAVVSIGALVPHARAQSDASTCADDGAGGQLSSDQPLAMTYFYYWYDAEALDDPRLSLHPPDGAPFDWRNLAWHRQQLLDMASAGVDVALPVYWGTAPIWSTEGLEQMVEARAELLREGYRAPALGLFLDTNLYSLMPRDRPDLLDLTGDDGQEMLVDQIMGFFDRVPVCHQARIDGRPLIVLWRADTEDGDVLTFDQTALDTLHERLEAQLGARPIIVRERTWDAYAAQLETTAQTDAAYRWGSALRGVLLDGQIAALGPGYDDRLFPERPGYVRDRDEGRQYAADLRVAVMSGATWILLETWNEFWEGTAIAETVELGRLYLDITSRYLAAFHQLGAEIVRDAWVDPATGESVALHVLADAVQERGFPEQAHGRWGTRPYVEEAEGVGYLHFALQPRFRFQAGQPVAIEVEYFDEGLGSFVVEYDSVDWSADQPEYKATAPVELRGTRRWLVQRFDIADARFEHGQYNGYGDFRIRDFPADGESTHLFGRVHVARDPAPRPVLQGPENLYVYSRGAAPPELRWRPVDGADGYVVQIAPIESSDPPVFAHDGHDREPCGAGDSWNGGQAQATTLVPICRLDQLRSAPPGLYRWRVWGVTTHGDLVGETSDWAFLFVEP